MVGALSLMCLLTVNAIGQQAGLHSYAPVEDRTLLTEPIENKVKASTAMRGRKRKRIVHRRLPAGPSK